jgi:hypothetical protein
MEKIALLVDALTKTGMTIVDFQLDSNDVLMQRLASIVDLLIDLDSVQLEGEIPFSYLEFLN